MELLGGNAEFLVFLIMVEPPLMACMGRSHFLHNCLFFSEEALPNPVSLVNSMLWGNESSSSDLKLTL